MKHGWMLYVWVCHISIYLYERWVTAGAATNLITGQQQLFVNPSWIESSNVAVAAVTIINHVAPYLIGFVKILLLWEPTLFSGGYVYLWWYFCFPIAAVSIMSLIMVIRGVSMG